MLREIVALRVSTLSSMSVGWVGSKGFFYVGQRRADRSHRAQGAARGSAVPGCPLC
jgi:hypothetical protein